MDPLVCSQVGGIVEGFATLGTYEGLLFNLRTWVRSGVLWLSSGVSDFLPWLSDLEALWCL